MNDTINWTKFEDLKHKSEKAYKAFKKFRRELDRAPLTNDQKIDVLKQFKVIDHL